MASENTIFASNTSSMLISEIAEAVAQQRKSRFFGLHFFNPVPVMKLVKVISTPGTDLVLLDRVTTWVESIGKFPVPCKDIPGFIVNQLLLPHVMHAIMIYEEGAVSGRDIDTAMKLGACFLMARLELADHIGLNVVKHILESLYAKMDFSSLFVKCPETLERLVAENKLGAKTGEGFYKYS